MSESDGSGQLQKAMQEALLGREELLLGNQVSRQKKIIEAAKALGRHIHCPYCDARTVAADEDRYAFICTRCDAEWDTNGREVHGPKKERSCEACHKGKLLPVPGMSLYQCGVCEARYFANGDRAICPNHAMPCSCFEKIKQTAKVARGEAQAEPGDRFIDLDEGD